MVKQEKIAKPKIHPGVSRFGYPSAEGVVQKFLKDIAPVPVPEEFVPLYISSAFLLNSCFKFRLFAVLRKTKNSRRKTYIIMKMSNTSDGSREVREPLVDKDMAESKPEQPWMVYLSTFVAVCGSFAFGSCTGYSSPAQAAIRNDLFRTIVEFSLFGSLLTFGAMIGAITSGPIADLVGRKGAMRVSSAFCVVGWL
ncbi:hypothetical protein F2Q69_00020814 [Brassica cretica]|uniref:Major facilitator superfamily (MFS) profile domain-containing protein n=1 Tax=Brassica cretica TaxID=69181 RepID=A0A8S9Q6S8_BRACR|nr:hypothetical protein F2Q69_00020814 [Brassica cretica]